MTPGNTQPINMNPVEWKKVQIAGGFWKHKSDINRFITLPAIYQQLKDSGRIESLNLTWRPGLPHKPHPYWDSDIAKWIEAASYSVGMFPDADLRDKIEDLIDKYEKIQHPDGYLNTYFLAVEPANRWTNVYVMHELYCAGHLLEAAIAHYQATGKERFLGIVRRYIDHIDAKFGKGKGKIPGYPGHPELELALVRLYRLTGEPKYLDLASFFVNQRGTQPYFFEQEALQRGEDPEQSPYKEILNKNYLPAGPYALFQAHLPVREQKSAEGHVVRAMYLYSAMADLAKEIPDASLQAACEELWQDVTERKMYITGGVGSLEISERFTFPYDLPNETAYNETCASIGLVFWAHRMLHVTGNRKYGDILEQTLYNGVLSGVSLSGDLFFYCNHLAVEWQVYYNRILRNPRMWPERKPWFDVSCCPPNLARLFASLGQYCYSYDSEGNVYVHLYIESTAEVPLPLGTVLLRQETAYPWNGNIRFTFSLQGPFQFGFLLRLPEWCPGYSIELNGSPLAAELQDSGYLKIQRVWNPGDILSLQLEMPIQLMESHPYVRMNARAKAIKRGPLVYCLEEEDMGSHLETILLDPEEVYTASFEPETLNGIVVIQGKAWKKDTSDWEGVLYRSRPATLIPVLLKAIPYFCWGNRSRGNMKVWIASK